MSTRISIYNVLSTGIPKPIIDDDTGTIHIQMGFADAHSHNIVNLFFDDERGYEGFQHEVRGLVRAWDEEE